MTKANPQFDLSRLEHLEQLMNKELIGQHQAVEAVANMIRGIKTDFYDEARPRGVLVFAGPTGVGKTELAKMTASELNVPLHRFDMAEFSESHTVARLIGSPPGYVDSGDGGQLVNALQNTPACVVLFDEIEKADKQIYKIFLSLFDEGLLTDARGHSVDAKSAVFILTTNLGSQEIYEHMQKGARDYLDARIKELCIKTFSSELYNRFDKVIIFNPLTQSSIEKIAEKYLTVLQRNFEKRTHSLQITWDPEVTSYLSNLNLDPSMGARDLQRKIKEQVFPKLQTSRIQGSILQTNAKVKIQIKDGKLDLAILDKGKIADPESSKVPTTARLLTLEKNIVTLNLRDGFPLKDAKQLYIFRLEQGNPAFTVENNCLRIVSISPSGEIIFKNLEGVPKFMAPRWNDERWRPITPERNGHAFFHNLCTLLPSAVLQLTTKILVDKIFTKLGESCHLSHKDIFGSLKEYCKRGDLMRTEKDKNELQKDIESLEKIFGSLSVNFMIPDPPKQNSLNPSGGKIPEKKPFSRL